MGKMNELDIENMNERDMNSDENTINDFEPTEKELQEMMIEMHIEEEVEVKDKILEDWTSVICVSCLKGVSLMKATFIDDAPYHKWCAEEELRNRYEE